MKSFILWTDASNHGVGAVWMQVHDGKKYPVAYASSKLIEKEHRYLVIEKECLAIVVAPLQKFQAYLYGRLFIIETDHQPLVHLQKARVLNYRLMRWSLFLQSYNFITEVIKGSEKIGADFLSRRVVE